MACNHSTPCSVPPHPDLVARLQEQARAAAPQLQVQGQEAPAGVGVPPTPETHWAVLRPPTNRKGLNDHTIFEEPPLDLAPPLRRNALERAPLRGSIKAAVVLVEFPDKRMAPGAAQRFQNLFFSGNKGSVTEYYKTVSGDKVAFEGQVVGPYMMPKKLTEYANNASGTSSAFPNVRTMAADALAKANGQIDFKPYDNDGNGMVDAFIVVHAGSGAEQTGSKSDIWSVKWVLPSQTPVDGVSVYAFLTIPEDAKLGVCAHELGHLVFGWPDLYDTDYSSEGIGNWCLMSGGSWNGPAGGAGTVPAEPSAWCKVNQGWATATNQTVAQNNAKLVDVKKSKQVVRLWKNGVVGKEYFLVENRQKTGYDGYLPGAGLLIWHIDDSVTSNTDERHYRVALEQADGRLNLENKVNRGDAGDVFPGTANNVAFTATSVPSSKAYDGSDSEVSVTNISAPAEQMTFNVNI